MEKDIGKRVTFEFWNDLDSLKVWEDMNWRNFTFFALDTEIDSMFYLCEIHLAVMGFHTRFTVWKFTTEKRKEYLDEFVKDYKNRGCYDSKKTS